MVDTKDGYRFQFHLGRNGTCEMRDVIEQFKPITLPGEFAEVLAQMLHEQHVWYVNQNSKINNLRSLLELCNENEELYTDVMIACIKYGMDYGE